MKTYRTKIAVFSLRKRTKAEGKMSPKILLEKNKERKNRKREEKETRRRKKNNGCTLSFMLTFLEIVVERKKNCLRGELVWL